MTSRVYTQPEDLTKHKTDQKVDKPSHQAGKTITSAHNRRFTFDASNVPSSMKFSEFEEANDINVENSVA